jgi:flagellar motor switch protein FliN
MNSEQEKINNIKDSIQHALIEGTRNIHSLFDSNFECTDVQIDSKFPAELALQIKDELVMIQTTFNTDYNDFGLMLVDIASSKYLIKQLMNHEEGEVVLDDFGLSAFSEITTLFYQGLTQHMSQYLGKTIKNDRSKVFIIDHNTQGISPFTTKVLSIHFNLKQNDQFIPVQLYFDFASFTGLVENQTDKKFNHETKLNKQDEIQVKEIRVPKYTNMNEHVTANPSKNLDLIMNVPLNVSIEIGKTKRKIKDIMSFASGYVLELEKQLGAPVDIVVNGQLIARGDVVVIDENFAIRITEIVSTSSLLPND